MTGTFRVAFMAVLCWGFFASSALGQETDAQKEKETKPELAPILGEDPIAQAYWRKAMEWIDGKHDASGKLLLRDLRRDYPGTRYGKMADDWLGQYGEIDQSGRVEMIIVSTLNGAALGYSLVAGIAGQNDHVGASEWKLATWSGLGGAGIGLLASTLLTRNRAVSESQAILFGYSGYWGWLNGFLVYDLISPLRFEDALLAGAGGMVLGMGTTLLLWKHLEVHPGAAQMTVTFSGYMMELLLLANLGIGGANVFRDSETIALLTLLLPANAAAVGGFFLGKELRWSANDIRLISLGGILGNLLGVTLVATTEPGSFESGMWMMEGSVILGLVGATMIVAPWKRAGSSDSKPRSTSSALLHVTDAGRLLVQAPIPEILPTQHHGKDGFMVNVPVLSLDL